MLRPYRPSPPFVACRGDAQGSDCGCGARRRPAQVPARAGAAGGCGRAAHRGIHRLRTRHRGAAALRPGRGRRRASRPSARLAERRTRNPAAAQALLSLPRHRGPTMVASSRAPLRADRLRAVNVPQPITVELDADGSPAALEASDGRTGGRADGSRQIEVICETWRIDDEWWRKPLSRRYVEVVLEGGKRVVLFEDLLTGEWFVQQP